MLTYWLCLQVDPSLPNGSEMLDYSPDSGRHMMGLGRLLTGAKVRTNLMLKMLAAAYLFYNSPSKDKLKSSIVQQYKFASCENCKESDDFKS